MRFSVAPEVERLLAPQERLDRLHDPWRRRAGADVCDLAYANAYDGPDPVVLDAMRAAIDSAGTLGLQYTPYGGRTVTRRLIADRLAEATDLPFRWRDVVLTPGAMAALTLCLGALGAAGRSQVIILTPCWLDVPLYVTQLGLEPVLVPLREGDFHLDLGRIEEALGDRTCALVLSNPANPTGHVYSDDEMRDLAALLLRTKRSDGGPPVLVSDECHRDVLFGPTPYTSLARHFDDTCVVYSFGKSLLVQGQRIGYAAVSPRLAGHRDLSVLLERLCRARGFCTPTALMQTAVQTLVRHKPDLARLADRRERLRAELTASGFEVAPGEATYFLYVRCPGPDDFEFTERLAARGVLVVPAAVFHHSGYFRVSVTASDAMIDRALVVFRDLAG